MTALYPVEDSESTDRLTCQWCSVQLPEGKAICPTCGSPGVPDPALSAPGVEILEPEIKPEPVQPKEELDEWWLADDVQATAARPATGGDLFEDRLLKTVGILAGAGAVCAFIGWLLGPIFLAPLMESITGSPVENINDLRPMGTVMGLLTGLFFGAGIGWVVQPER